MRAEVVAPPAGPGRLVLRRLIRDRVAMSAAVVLVVLVAVAALGGRAWRFDVADRVPAEASQGPSWAHPMGTDGIGKDTLAQVLRGAQRSVQVMVLVSLLATAAGTAVGALAGFRRGWVDAVVMRLVDLALTLPPLAVLAVLSRRVGGGSQGLALSVVIAAFAWMPVARVVRAEVLSLRERDFVEAARALGAGPVRTVVRHVLPNAVGPIATAATFTMAGALLAETSLSYLGLGVRAPDTSLGLLVAQGQSAAQTRPWLFYFPGAVLIALVGSAALVGEGVRAAFDPRRRRDGRR